MKNVPGLSVTDQTNDDLRQGQFTYVMDPGMLMIHLLRTVTLTDLSQPHWSACPKPQHRFPDKSKNKKKNNILNNLLTIIKRLVFIGGWGACHDVTFLL